MNWNFAQNLARSYMDQLLPIRCFHRLNMYDRLYDAITK